MASALFQQPARDLTTDPDQGRQRSGQASPRYVKPKGKPQRAAASLSTELLLLVSYRGNACSAPERRIKARAQDQLYACDVLAFARVRAFVVGFELRFQMTHSCVTLHFLRYSLVNLSNTGSAQSILTGFRVVNTTERNDFGAWRGRFPAAFVGDPNRRDRLHTGRQLAGDKDSLRVLVQSNLSRASSRLTLQVS